MSQTAGIVEVKHCQYCGALHETLCPKIKALEYDYNEDKTIRTIRRVEFFPPEVPRGTTPSYGNAACIHPESERVNVPRNGHRESWYCRACGFVHKIKIGE